MKNKKTATAKTTAKATSGHPLVGKLLPNLELTVVKANTAPKKVKISTLCSKGLCVLYFYPKDNTPGCTTESCEFGERLKDFEALDAKVVGISPDSALSHQKFIEKYSLPFELVSDTEKELCQALDLWKLKKFMGREYMGVERSTFLVKDKKILYVWQPVKVPGHVEEVRQKIQELGAI